MIRVAKERHSDLSIRRLNILDEDPGPFDIVIANGIFYLLGADAKTVMQELIARMFEIAKETVVFTSLSTRASVQNVGEFHADAAETFNFCQSLCDRMVLRHDYLQHDFAIYMYKSLILTAHQPAYLPWLGYVPQNRLGGRIRVLRPSAVPTRGMGQPKQDQDQYGRDLAHRSRQAARQFMDKTISDIEIDDSLPWTRKHWRALQTNYARAPYFPRYADFFEDVWIPGASGRGWLS